MNNNQNYTDKEYQPESDNLHPPKISRLDLERELLSSGRFCWKCKKPLAPHDLRDCECNECAN
jgi:hypothetical protein